MSLARNVALISASAASCSSTGSNTTADAPRRVASFAALLTRARTSAWGLTGSSFSFAEETGDTGVAIGPVPRSVSMERSVLLTAFVVVPLVFVVALLLLERFLGGGFELVLAVGIQFGHVGSRSQIEQIGQQRAKK
jgi:hypothetical protein